VAPALMGLAGLGVGALGLGALANWCQCVVK